MGGTQGSVMQTFTKAFFTSQPWFMLVANLVFTGILVGYLWVASRDTAGYPAIELPRLAAGLALAYAAVLAGFTYTNGREIFAVLLIFAIGIIGTFIVPVPPEMLTVGGSVGATLMTMWNLEQFPQNRSILTKGFVFFPAGAMLGSLYALSEVGAITTALALLLVQVIFTFVTFTMERAVSHA